MRWYNANDSRMGGKGRVDWVNVAVYTVMPLLSMALWAWASVAIWRGCGRMVGGTGFPGADAREVGAPDTVSVRRDTVRDTVTVWVRDTVTEVRKERVVCYVGTPSVRDGGDTLRSGDTLGMAVVQREYTDDSTYRAWVSGVRFGAWPRLDSIDVRRRAVTERVKEVVTLVERPKARRWSLGVVGGYGYGFSYGGFEPFVGVGVSYRLFPP